METHAAAAVAATTAAAAAANAAAAAAAAPDSAASVDAAAAAAAAATADAADDYASHRTLCVLATDSTIDTSRCFQREALPSSYNQNALVCASARCGSLVSWSDSDAQRGEFIAEYSAVPPNASGANGGHPHHHLPPPRHTQQQDIDNHDPPQSITQPQPRHIQPPLTKQQPHYHQHHTPATRAHSRDTSELPL